MDPGSPRLHDNRVVAVGCFLFFVLPLELLKAAGATSSERSAGKLYSIAKNHSAGARACPGGPSAGSGYYVTSGRG
jgi:hypothetical protein